VHVNSGFNAATVDTLQATAQLSYADIAKELASQLSVGGLQIGTIQVTDINSSEVKAGYSVLGVSVSATVGVSLVQGANNTLEFKSISFDSPLSSVFTPQNFDFKFSLGDLPFGMNLTKLTLAASELDVSATGTNVNLNQNSVSGG
jgi:hypothetical protein